jgi:hypothetical protein
MNPQLQMLLNTVQMLKAQIIQMEQQLMVLIQQPPQPPVPGPPQPGPYIPHPIQQTPPGYVPPGIAPGTPPSGI